MAPNPMKFIGFRWSHEEVPFERLAVPPGTHDNLLQVWARPVGDEAPAQADARSAAMWPVFQPGLGNVYMDGSTYPSRTPTARAGFSAVVQLDSEERVAIAVTGLVAPGLPHHGFCAASTYPGRGSRRRLWLTTALR